MKRTVLTVLVGQRPGEPGLVAAGTADRGPEGRRDRETMRPMKAVSLTEARYATLALGQMIAQSTAEPRPAQRRGATTYKR